MSIHHLRSLFSMNEARTVDQYLEGFRAIPDFDKVEKTFRDRVQQAIDVLQKNDRVTWFVRYLKIRLLLDLQEKFAAPAWGDLDDSPKEGGEANGPKLEKVEKLLNRELQKFEANGISREKVVTEIKDSFVSLLSSLTHFYTRTMLTNIPEIGNFTYNFQLPGDVLDHFNTLQTAWQQKMIDTEKSFISDEFIEYEGDEIWVRVGNDWAWFHLDRESCSVESEAMGHCGASNRDGSSLLSYRNRATNSKGETGWVPWLTFERDSDGYIRQAKTRGNHKPPESFHPAIIELLKHPEIKGVKGGGYRPHTNFRLSDLSSSEVSEIEEANPEFEVEPMPDFIKEYKANGVSDSFIRMINRRFSPSFNHLGDGLLELTGYSTWVREFAKDHLHFVPKQSNSHYYTANDLSEFTGIDEDDYDEGYVEIEDFADTDLDDFNSDNPGEQRPRELIASFIDYALSNSQLFSDRINRLAKRKGIKIDFDREALAKNILSGDLSSTIVGELVNSAVEFGLTFVSDEGNVKTLTKRRAAFVAYMSQSFYFNSGVYATVEGDLEENLEETFNKFLNKKVGFFINASELISEYEEAVSNYDYDDDGESSYDPFYDITESSYVSEGAREKDNDYNFNHFLTTDEAEKAMEHGRDKERSDERQMTLDGEDPAKDLLFDREMALSYLDIKLRSGILENFNMSKRLKNLLD